MRWVRRGVVGLLVLAVVVPVLVLAGATAGLSPRHWSGTQLVAVGVRGLIASTPPPDADGRTYTESELRSLRDGLTSVNLPEGTDTIYTDAHRRQVIVTTVALTHGGFALCGERYGDAVALTWEPFAGAFGFGGSEQGPSAWSRTRPFISWLTLATGFPWYLAAGVLLTVGGWVLVRWLRRKRPAAAAIPADPTQS